METTRKRMTRSKRHAGRIARDVLRYRGVDAHELFRAREGAA